MVHVDDFFIRTITLGTGREKAESPFSRRLSRPVLLPRGREEQDCPLTDSLCPRRNVKGQAHIAASRSAKSTLLLSAGTLHGSLLAVPLVNFVDR